MDEWIRAKDAAEILGVHLSAIPKMICRGDLTRRRRRPILNRGEVIAYRDARNAARLSPAKRRPTAGPPAPPDLEHEWLTPDQAADLLGISRIAVNARARRDRLPSALANGRRWYRADHLHLYLMAQAAKRNKRANVQSESR
jgi:hypothetical protein